MAGVPDFIADGPLWGLFIFLLIVVFLRAQATYWLGRGVRAGLLSSRWHTRFEGPGMDRANAYLERWGPIGIPVSFLTVGFQTLVNAAAGFARMRWPLYTVAMIPGCLAWAAVYTLVGLSLWAGAVRLGQESPWLLAGVLALLAAVVALAIRLRRTAVGASRTPR